MDKFKRERERERERKREKERETDRDRERERQLSPHNKSMIAQRKFVGGTTITLRECFLSTNALDKWIFCHKYLKR